MAASSLGFELKIVGDSAGYNLIEDRLLSLGAQLLGRVDDEELYRLYARAKGFIGLARQEDFGMAVVESQAAGTPAIVFNGGGFRESVIDGVTGILIEGTDEKTIEEAMKRFNKVKWDKKKLEKNARRFSRERFEKKIGEVVENA